MMLKTGELENKTASAGLLGEVQSELNSAVTKPDLVKANIAKESMSATHTLPDESQNYETQAMIIQKQIYIILFIKEDLFY